MPTNNYLPKICIKNIKHLYNNFTLYNQIKFHQSNFIKILFIITVFSSSLLSISTIKLNLYLYYYKISTSILFIENYKKSKTIFIFSLVYTNINWVIHIINYWKIL
jgi:hypothetical protein